MTSSRFCSACGAALTEAARFCASCGSPVAPAPPLAGRAAPLDDEIRERLRQGQKLEAIKLVRERTGLGLKEAKDRVDALAAGMPSGSIPGSGWGGCLGCLVAIVGSVVLFIAAFAGFIRLSGAYGQALALARADPRIVAVLGEPIVASPFVLGNIGSSRGRWSVATAFTLSGPRGKGTLRLRATTMRSYRDPRWDQYSTFEYYRDGEPHSITLRAPGQ
jgi:hypothetical protein